MKQTEFIPYGSDAALDNFVDSGKKSDVLHAISLNYSLDKIRERYGETYDFDIADSGSMFDSLIYSKDEEVRGIIADRGYGLDLLSRDHWPYVKMCVGQYLVSHGYKDIDDWKQKNPEKCVLRRRYA